MEIHFSNIKTLEELLKKKSEEETPKKEPSKEMLPEELEAMMGDEEYQKYLKYKKQ